MTCSRRQIAGVAVAGTLVGALAALMGTVLSADVDLPTVPRSAASPPTLEAPFVAIPALEPAAGATPAVADVTSATASAAAPAEQPAGGSEGVEVYQRVWLARHQADDGSWSAYGWPCGDCRGEWGGRLDDDVARTSLALLAFAGGGHTHRFGRYKRLVRKALKWLKARQQRGGVVGLHAGRAALARNHGLATFALCELYALSRDFTLKRYALQALRACERELLPWLHWLSPAEAGWVVLAIGAAKSALLEIPESTLARLRECSVDGVDPARSAVGVLAQLRAGARRSDPALRAAGERLSRSDVRRSPAHTYLVTSATFRLQKDAWLRWCRPLQDRLLRSQRIDEGCADGSWDPTGLLDRVEATALSTLMLEVYYRYERAVE